MGREDRADRLVNLFVYGTLQDPALVRRLTGASLEMCDATLEGYRKAPHSRIPYPSIIPDERMSVPGKLIHDITPEALLRLDEYETPEYRRIQVSVTLSSGERVDAEAYVQSGR